MRQRSRLEGSGSSGTQGVGRGEHWPRNSVAGVLQGHERLEELLVLIGEVIIEPVGKGAGVTIPYGSVVGTLAFCQELWCSPWIEHRLHELLRGLGLLRGWLAIRVPLGLPAAELALDVAMVKPKHWVVDALVLSHSSGEVIRILAVVTEHLRPRPLDSSQGVTTHVVVELVVGIFDRPLGRSIACLDSGKELEVWLSNGSVYDVPHGWVARSGVQCPREVVWHRRISESQCTGGAVLISELGREVLSHLLLNRHGCEPSVEGIGERAPLWVSLPFRRPDGVGRECYLHGQRLAVPGLPGPVHHAKGARAAVTAAAVREHILRVISLQETLKLSRQSAMPHDEWRLGVPAEGVREGIALRELLGRCCIGHRGGPEVVLRPVAPVVGVGVGLYLGLEELLESRV
mmetsp:Transcript_55027/g.76281  ORF Transcript_55027/g.76281 Transcript_55027/m.76281 type:complete len:403 (-) Transcript_55027:6-1214(-)